MRTTLEDLYYGNITPNEQRMTLGSKMKKAVDRGTGCEKQLMEQLGETEQEILTKLIRSQHEINSATARRSRACWSGTSAKIFTTISALFEGNGETRSPLFWCVTAPLW